MTRSEVAARLRSMGENMIAIADYVAGLPEEEAAPETAASAPKEERKSEEKKIRLEDVRAVLSDISRSGHTAEMKALLAKHGAKRLSDIDPDDYADLLAEAKEVKNA